MTLLMNTLTKESDTSNYDQQDHVADKQTLEITTSTGYTNPSLMSEEQKNEKQKNLDSIAELFEQDLRDKGEYDPSKVNWTSDQTVQIKDLPKMSLHSFILKAEELGLNISYTKQTIINISN